MYTAVCDAPLTHGSNGELLCTGTLFVEQRPQTLNDLSMSDVGLLLSATVGLWCLAFGIKKVIYMFYINPGRSG